MKLKSKLKNKTKIIITIIISTILITFAYQATTYKMENEQNKIQTEKKYSEKYAKPSQDELKKLLTPQQYHITQNKGTERPFENEYWDNKEDGIYVDIVTGEPLFSSLDKYDSGSGWPAFTKPIEKIEIQRHQDTSHGMIRTEVTSKAGSHLGHVFPDGPAELGGERFCINSGALKFIPKEELEKEGYSEYKYLFDN